MVIPTSQQVGALITEAGIEFDAFVGLCAFAGLRLGEAAALQVGDVDFLRRGDQRSATGTAGKRSCHRDSGTEVWE